MIEKNIALDILKDIQEIILSKNEQQILQTIEIYRKNIELTTNLKIQKLIKKQNKSINTYGENSFKSKWIKRKIDKEIIKIFNS